MPRVVLIEDEVLLGRQLARALEASGHEVRTAETGAAGLEAIAEWEPDLVLLDLRLPDCFGLDVLEKIRERGESLPVVLMTAHGSVRDAVEAMRLGAADYLQKPLDLDELRLTIDRVLSTSRQERELAYHRDRERAAPSGVIGSDARLLGIFTQIERLKAANLPPGKRPAILLTGETGTGKGIVARAIHEILGEGPFIELNCTAMPPTMVEAELFGHEKGSFTDARAARTGLFEAAAGGTIFLDEIGHVELDLQAKFLKVIEDKRIRRIGSNRDRPVDVHVVAATNQDLDQAVIRGEFREDLLHRLRVLSFHIPPLRERPGDIAQLAHHFAHEIGHLYGGVDRSLTPEAEELLCTYRWPGNARELRNLIERAVLLSPDKNLTPDAFKGLLSVQPRADDSGHLELPDDGIDLADLERDLLRQALEKSDGNRTQAARLLGLTRDTLRYRMEKFQLE